MSLKKLENKLERDELDLSMSRLREIPVSDIASLRKATKLDLSNNEIVQIPQNFATSLPHVIKIDLSSNKLRELPNNFGSLINLKHLDLYSNQLTDLPLSLSSLQNLRYLDLKNNPLRVDLTKVAGNCLDNKECQFAAKRVIEYLRKLKVEKDREFALAEFREKEKNMAKQRQEEEDKLKENEKKKMEKKALKEKRRVEMEEAKKKQQQQQQQQTKMKHNENVQNGKSNRKETEKKTSQNKEFKNNSNKNSGKWSWLGILNWFLLFGVLISACVVVGIYSDGDFSEKGFSKAYSKAVNNSKLLLEITKETATIENARWAVESSWKVVGPYALKVQETLLMGLSATKNLVLTSFQGLQSFTGDLSPYVDGLMSYWESFKRSLEWLVAKVDVWFMLEGVRWFFHFMLDQFRILSEEFWSNEAIVAIWRDMKPIRESVWSNTVILRYYYWQINEELSVTWLPWLKQLSVDFYHAGSEKMANLFA